MSRSLGAIKMLKFLDWEVTLLEDVVRAMANQRSNRMMKTSISAKIKDWYLIQQVPAMEQAMTKSKYRDVSYRAPVQTVQKWFSKQPGIVICSATMFTSTS